MPDLNGELQLGFSVSRFKKQLAFKLGEVKA